MSTLPLLFSYQNTISPPLATFIPVHGETPLPFTTTYVAANRHIMAPSLRMHHFTRIHPTNSKAI